MPQCTQQKPRNIAPLDLITILPDNIDNRTHAVGSKGLGIVKRPIGQHVVIDTGLTHFFQVFVNSILVVIGAIAQSGSRPLNIYIRRVLRIFIQRSVKMVHSVCPSKHHRKARHRHPPKLPTLL